MIRSRTGAGTARRTGDYFYAVDQLHHPAVPGDRAGLRTACRGRLMERKPRQPERPILTRGGFAWLMCVGLVMGVGTLGVISWAEQAHNQEIAHTMGVVTFSLYALFFSIATREERRTVFRTPHMKRPVKLLHFANWANVMGYVFMYVSAGVVFAHGELPPPTGTV